MARADILEGVPGGSRDAGTPRASFPGFKYSLLLEGSWYTDHHILIKA
jgi:hypothetical protein